MDVDTKALAELISKIDPTSTWQYNEYCPKCGTFIHDGKNQCRKCNCNFLSNTPIKNAIPFATSATAIEKLILWLRDNKNTESENQDFYTNLYSKVCHIIKGWLDSERTPESYRVHIVIICTNALEDYANTTSKKA